MERLDLRKQKLKGLSGKRVSGSGSREMEIVSDPALRINGFTFSRGTPGGGESSGKARKTLKKKNDFYTVEQKTWKGISRFGS